MNFLTEATVSAQPGWTVGWPVNVGQNIDINQTAALAVSAPAGWNARYLKTSLNLTLKGANLTSFLLVDIPADAADGKYDVTATATVGSQSKAATASVQVGRPTTNLVHNGTRVSMDYVGFLESNQVFDTSMWSVASQGLEKWPDFANSSASRHQPDYNPLQLTVGTGQVIKGWEIGLQNMSLGQGKALIIPPELAYGRFFEQVLNLSEEIPIYNETTQSGFTASFGEAPTIDAEYKHPLYGWTVRVVDIDNVSLDVVLQHLPQESEDYKPYGINATVSNLSSAAGSFWLTYAPVDGAGATNFLDTGEVIEVNATNFTVRWQTEHRQTLAPFTLYFLVYVRTAS
ncbi:MAG: FKBP-type peptidyl-prolyl cis-trans isomerase [Candidatus Rokuibacteriota bacterium]